MKRWSKLQVRMTISYVAVSVGAALLLELLLLAFFLLVVLRLPFSDQNSLSTAELTAQNYALEAAVQGGGVALNPHSTFQPGLPSSLNMPGVNPTVSVPYTNAGSSCSQAVKLALLIAPDGKVVASSCPARYPVSASIAQLLPDQAQLIRDALAGKAGNTVDVISEGHITSVAQPVLNTKNQPIGAVYVQMPPVSISGGSFFSLAGGLLFTGLFWIIILAPIGTIFGVLVTRGLVRRLHRLVQATAKFATGDYTQRVPITRQDEIGQLESQFNQMAEQLVESIAQQQALTEQQARLEERARIEQELSTARYIQQALLPKDLPVLPGSRLVPFYRPAKEVGGDFYDFIVPQNGHLGLVIGDATGKGVPAALVMTTTSTMLRAASQGTLSPGQVLAQVNDLLSAEIPSGMFVTCFYAILDLSTGLIRYANAGHDWPYRRHGGGVSALQATGMPLGMMPGTRYEEQEEVLEAGESLLFYSDGLVEAHNAQHEMFGLPRLEALVSASSNGSLIDVVLDGLAAFTGADWEQEDDVTLVLLQRTLHPVAEEETMSEQDGDWRTFINEKIASEPGNERQAAKQVREAVDGLNLPTERLSSLETAVAEAVMNAMEHGNHFLPDKPVTLQLRVSATAISVRVGDEGTHPITSAQGEPDLEAKLAGQQSPRGWGLFLIKNLVDEMHVTQDQHHHIIELVMYRT